MRSSVPEARSRCMVIAVMMNITKSGNRPSRIRHALLNGDRRTRSVRGVLEHEVHQRDNQDRHRQDHRDAAVIGGKLAQDPKVVAPYGFRDP